MGEYDIWELENGSTIIFTHLEDLGLGDTMENFGGALTQQGSYDSPKMVRMPTMKERLAQAVIDAESRLADAKRAKEILDKNPELEELLNLMQKGRF